MPRQVSFSTLLSWATECVERVRRVNGITKEACSLETAQPVSTFGALASDLERRSKLNEVDVRIQQESARLEERYGSRFRGLETDWPDILAALDWSWQVIQHFGASPIPDTYIDRCTSADHGWHCCAGYAGCLDRYRERLATLCKMFDDGYPLVSGKECNQSPFWGGVDPCGYADKPHG